MIKQPSIKSLRREIAIERAKLARASKRRKLQSELKEIRSGQKTSIRLVRRFGRGLRITGKKVGGALARQARLIAEQQERQRIATLKTRRQVRTIPKKKRKIVGGQDLQLFGGIDNLNI